MSSVKWAKHKLVVLINKKRVKVKAWIEHPRWRREINRRSSSCSREQFTIKWLESKSGMPSDSWNMTNSWAYLRTSLTQPSDPKEAANFQKVLMALMIHATVIFLLRSVLQDTVKIIEVLRASLWMSIIACQHPRCHKAELYWPWNKSLAQVVSNRRTSHVTSNHQASWLRRVEGPQEARTKKCTLRLIMSRKCCLSRSWATY